MRGALPLKCGVNKHIVHEDTVLKTIRLAPEDVAGEVGLDGKSVEPGLYMVAPETFAKYKPRVVERLKRTPAVGHDGRPVVDAEGKPVMVVPADATPETVSERLLY